MSKSFLKYAGGKTKLVEILRPLLTRNSSRRLVEPFCGSCAVSLGLSDCFDEFLLRDTNDDIINLFIELQRNKGFVDYCEQLFCETNNCAEAYYKLRDDFNDDWGRHRSALFVYLNRHCFNGLCRYNASGKFNVPFGKYSKPYFPRKEMEEFVKLAEKFVFCNADFRTTIRDCKPSDVVYCDPPYIPLSITSNFTAYNGQTFSLDDHKNLAELAEDSPCRVVISNSDTEITRDLYKRATRLVEVSVSRTISSKASTRVKAKELIAIYDCQF